MKKHVDILKTKRPRHNWITLPLLAAVTIGLTLSVAGCNTMQGLGKDVEKAGEAIQKSTK